MSAAESIIKKCGGVSKTAKLAGTSENWVYRWTYPKDKGGTGGEVPAPAQRNLIAAAARGECDVTPADFFPDAAQ